MFMCFQPGVPAFTVSQPDDAMAVLIDRAKERNVSDHRDLYNIFGHVSVKYEFLNCLGC